MPRDYKTEADALVKGEGIPKEAYDKAESLQHLPGGTSDEPKKDMELGNGYVPIDEVPDPNTMNVEDEIIKKIDESIEHDKEEKIGEVAAEIRTHHISQKEIDKMESQRKGIRDLQSENEEQYLSVPEHERGQSSHEQISMRSSAEDGILYKGQMRDIKRGAERDYKGKQYQRHDKKHGDKKAA